MEDKQSSKKKPDRREYHRKWRREHPDKVRAAQIRYWQKQLENQTQEEKDQK